jgi:hypothetical protein
MYFVLLIFGCQRGKETLSNIEHLPLEIEFGGNETDSFDPKRKASGINQQRTKIAKKVFLAIDIIHCHRLLGQDFITL